MLPETSSDSDSSSPNTDTRAESHCDSDSDSGYTCPNPMCVRMFWADRGDCRDCDLRYSEVTSDTDEINSEISNLTEGEDTDFPNDDITDEELVAILESCKNESDDESTNEYIPN